MRFDYSKLLGRIKEKGFTQMALAKLICITAGSMSEKLNNLANFKQREIIALCDILDIKLEEIGAYFFTAEVRKNESSDEATANE